MAPVKFWMHNLWKMYEKIPEIDINYLVLLEKQAKIYFVVCILQWNILMKFGSQTKKSGQATPVIKNW